MIRSDFKLCSGPTFLVGRWHITTNTVFNTADLTVKITLRRKINLTDNNTVLYSRTSFSDKQGNCWTWLDKPKKQTEHFKLFFDRLYKM